MITSFVEKSSINGEIIEISDKVEINHMKNSFRLQLGDRLRVVDGEFEYITEIIEITKKEILCKIVEKREDEFSTGVEIHGGLGLLKNDKMELVIQKLVEIGISKIIPIEMERTVVKIKEKKDKWDTIVKESLKQCQAVKLTEIDEVKKLKEIPYEEYDLVLVPYENEEDIKIIEINGLKIATLICFELRFPQLWEKIKGADVILNPAMWGLKRKDHYESISKALALVNQCFVIACNSANDNMAKGSAIISPFGNVIKDDLKTKIEANFDKNEIKKVRTYINIGLDR